MQEQTTVFNTLFPKLEKYGYRYQFDGNELIIKTNRLAFLKVKYKNDKFEFSNRLHFGLRFTTLEYNFVLYILIFSLFLLPTSQKYPLIIVVCTVAFFCGLVLLSNNLLSTKRQVIDWLEEGNKI
jgi:hypothetical protein